MGAQTRVVLVPRRFLDPLPDAGGVDEAVHRAVHLDQFVDRVDGGAGHVVDDHPLPAGDLVQQARLADVRLADDRHPARSALHRRGFARRLRNRRQDRVQQVPAPPAVQRGHRERLTQSEVPHRRRFGLRALVVDLVRRQHHRLLAPPQDLDHGLVDILGADRGVDHEDDRVRRGDGQLGLLGDLGGHALGVGRPATGVDQHELPAVPVRVVGHPVPGHSRDVLDDGFAAADDPVDQRRLADVGTADDGDDGHGQGRLGGRKVSHGSVHLFFDDPAARGFGGPGKGSPVSP